MINCAELGVYRPRPSRQTVPLATALAWAGVMKYRSQKADKKPLKPKRVYMRKSISGPEDTIKKGTARAQLLGRSFSEHVMRLLEDDYARDETVVMTVVEKPDSYRAFRQQHPPSPLPPEIPRSGSRPEGDG